MKILPQHYKIIYRKGADRVALEIADFYRTENGKFIFEYKENPAYEFPGFDVSHKKYENDVLWEQILFRVPNHIRNIYANIPPEVFKSKKVKRKANCFACHKNFEKGMLEDIDIKIPK